MREADVAIRMSPPRQPGLVRRRLMQLRYHLYASPQYLEAHGTPKKPQDLDGHKLIAYGEGAHPPAPNLNWLLEAGSKDGRRRAVLRVNSIHGIFRAVQNGIGIAALPEYMSREAQNLVEVLPELRGPVSILFSSIRKNFANRSASPFSGTFWSAGSKRTGLESRPSSYAKYA